MKEIRKTVDNHLPKWLHSRILNRGGFYLVKLKVMKKKHKPEYLRSLKN